MKEQSETQFKKLERDGNGNIVSIQGKKHKYRVFRPGEPIGIVRYSVYNKTSLALAVGQPMRMMFESDQAIMKLLTGSKSPEEKILETASLVMSRQKMVLEKSRLRYDLAFYQATVFAVREGDDPAVWSEEMANEYLDDWAPVVDPEDIFFFSLSTVVGLNEHLRLARDAVLSQAGILSDYITTREVSENWPTNE
jgi:hypothetical protein